MGTQEKPLCSIPKVCLVQLQAVPLLSLLLFSFLGAGPDLKKLSALGAILKDSPTSISRTLLSNYSFERFQEECQRILEQLQESSSFSVARNVAELAALPVDNVVIQEVPWSPAFFLFIPVDCISPTAKLVSSCWWLHFPSPMSGAAVGPDLHWLSGLSQHSLGPLPTRGSLAFTSHARLSRVQ